MSDVADLSPARFAALVAPAIDRVFASGMRAGRDAGRELVMSYGGPHAVGVLVDLRNPLTAGRTVGADAVAGPYRYQDPQAVWKSLQRAADHGLLSTTEDGGYTPTERGRAFLTELHAQHATVLGELWEADHTARVDRTVALVGRLLEAADATGGSAWAVLAPPHEPPDATPGVLLLNRLSALRAHRADAHAAAWEAAGLTAQQIVTMPPGPEREAIEDSTNERAGAPYAALDPEERLAMLADLAALP